MIKSGLYLHIPFCSRRCGYCDFNTFAGQSHLIPQYVEALCQELEVVGKRYQGRYTIDSIFFGGGTPSLLTVGQFDKILSQIRRLYTMEEDCEVTLEANPGTVSAESLKSLHGLGFTRISFGMQSAHPQDLHILDRRHNFKDVLNAVGWSRQAGFEHINVDLIFGIPGQPLSRWQQNLALVTQLPVDHLSLYSLILEEGTPLYGWYQHGLIDLIDDDLTADMYEAAMELLPKAGYRQYEISNWAKERSDCLDARCRHNLNTWRYHPYFGLGAGASGFIEDTRRVNVGQIPVYLGKMKEMEGKWPAAETVTRLTLWEEMQEWMMVGLRKVEEGVSASEFRRRFDQPLEAVFGEQIGKLKKQGLLEEVVEGDDHLQLTKRGIMLGNRAFSEFIDNEKPSFIE